MRTRCLALILAVLCVGGRVGAEGEKIAGFKQFHERALAGERLNVVFYGHSVTWGANASDQAYTSYRARVEQMFDAAYPKAPIKYHDAAIGGSDPIMTYFRLDRDVLRHKPDLVFIDFFVNGGPADSNIPAYEAAIRRIITEARAPVVQMLFLFKYCEPRSADWKTGHRDYNRFAELASAYHTPIGDALTEVYNAVHVTKQYTHNQLWPFDSSHPGDIGYKLFADAAYKAFREGVESNTVCTVPERMIHTNLFMSSARVRISQIGPLPEGWAIQAPTRVGACHDWTMSRWLDEVLVCNMAPAEGTGKGGKPEEKPVPSKIAPLVFKVNASFVALMGEGTPKCWGGGMSVRIDGKEVLFEGPDPSKKINYVSFFQSCYRQGWVVLARDLPTDKDHVIEVTPELLDSKTKPELRVESVCVAGGKATVSKP